MLGATSKRHRNHSLQGGSSMELVGVILESIRRDSEVDPFEGGEAVRARDRVDGPIIRIEPTQGAGNSRADDGLVRALFGHSDQESELCHHRPSGNSNGYWSPIKSDGSVPVPKYRKPFVTNGPGAQLKATIGLVGSIWAM
jgi:hypothetical protein